MGLLSALEKSFKDKSLKEKSFKDSLSLLEADIYRANTLASEFLSNGSCLQFRISYTPAATDFLFLAQHLDCRVAEALGLLRVSIYKVYINGKTTMSKNEKKASIKKFYAFIFPTLAQLRRGITDMVDEDRRTMLLKRYSRRVDKASTSSGSALDSERNECEICMETKERLVIPICNHCLCLKCFQDWKSKSQECPFCRCNISGLTPEDLLVFIERRHAVDFAIVYEDSLRRLYRYIDKLPQIS